TPRRRLPQTSLSRSPGRLGTSEVVRGNLEASMSCERPFNCPKCGGMFAGPTYSRDSFGEKLNYTCTTCGYNTSTPTNDQRRNIGSRSGCPNPGENHGGEP